MNLPEAPDARAVGQSLNQILLSLSQPALPAELAERFGVFTTLLLRWNARMNLTAIRDLDGILRRHLAESIACARLLPPKIGTLLDFGSGAGFPGIPIALCRPEIEVTLGESQGKKAAFLQEACRALGLPALIFSSRLETLEARFDCVTLRAVDRMQDALRLSASKVTPHGLLAVLTTVSAQPQAEIASGDGFTWQIHPLPGADKRILLLGRRS
ncbi:16S rRNA (guanine(527)-N(7))-methyltransferase RsmG [Acidobacteria bacterium AB60]|nr:16S rRNA (guanine(527)-N(7))-methyltransferase RsmG [Acidobacteria bacterium AB60]